MDGDILRRHNDWRHRVVGGLEAHGVSFQEEVLEGCLLLVYQPGGDHIPVVGLDYRLEQDQIAVDSSGICVRVAEGRLLGGGPSLNRSSENPGPLLLVFSLGIRTLQTASRFSLVSSLPGYRLRIDQIPI